MSAPAKPASGRGVSRRADAAAPTESEIPTTYVSGCDVFMVGPGSEVLSSGRRRRPPGSSVLVTVRSDALFVASSLLDQSLIRVVPLSHISAIAYAPFGVRLQVSISGEHDLLLIPRLSPFQRREDGDSDDDDDDDEEHMRAAITATEHTAEFTDIDVDVYDLVPWDGKLTTSSSEVSNVLNGGGESGTPGRRRVSHELERIVDGLDKALEQLALVFRMSGQQMTATTIGERTMSFSSRQRADEETEVHAEQQFSTYHTLTGRKLQTTPSDSCGDTGLRRTASCVGAIRDASESEGAIAMVATSSRRGVGSVRPSALCFPGAGALVMDRCQLQEALDYVTVAERTELRRRGGKKIQVHERPTLDSWDTLKAPSPPSVQRDDVPELVRRLLFREPMVMFGEVVLHRAVVGLSVTFDELAKEGGDNRSGGMTAAAKGDTTTWCETEYPAKSLRFFLLATAKRAILYAKSSETPQNNKNGGRENLSADPLVHRGGESNIGDDVRVVAHFPLAALHSISAYADVWPPKRMELRYLCVGAQPSLLDLSISDPKGSGSTESPPPRSPADSSAPTVPKPSLKTVNVMVIAEFLVRLAGREGVSVRLVQFRPPTNDTASMRQVRDGGSSADRVAAASFPEKLLESTTQFLQRARSLSPLRSASGGGGDGESSLASPLSLRLPTLQDVSGTLAGGSDALRSMLTTISSGVQEVVSKAGGRKSGSPSASTPGNADEASLMMRGGFDGLVGAAGGIGTHSDAAKPSVATSGAFFSIPVSGRNAAAARRERDDVLTNESRLQSSYATRRASVLHGSMTPTPPNALSRSMSSFANLAKAVGSVVSPHGNAQQSGSAIAAGGQSQQSSGVLPPGANNIRRTLPPITGISDYGRPSVPIRQGFDDGGMRKVLLARFVVRLPTPTESARGEGHAPRILALTENHSGADPRLVISDRTYLIRARIAVKNIKRIDLYADDVMEIVFITNPTASGATTSKAMAMSPADENRQQATFVFDEKKHAGLGDHPATRLCDLVSALREILDLDVGAVYSHDTFSPYRSIALSYMSTTTVTKGAPQSGGTIGTAKHGGGDAQKVTSLGQRESDDGTSGGGAPSGGGGGAEANDVVVDVRVSLPPQYSLPAGHRPPPRAIPRHWYEAAQQKGSQKLSLHRDVDVVLLLERVQRLASNKTRWLDRILVLVARAKQDVTRPAAPSSEIAVGTPQADATTSLGVGTNHLAVRPYPLLYILDEDHTVSRKLDTKQLLSVHVIRDVTSASASRQFSCVVILGFQGEKRLILRMSGGVHEDGGVGVGGGGNNMGAAAAAAHGGPSSASTSSSHPRTGGNRGGMDGVDGKRSPTLRPLPDAKQIFSFLHGTGVPPPMRVDPLLDMVVPPFVVCGMQFVNLLRKYCPSDFEELFDETRYVEGGESLGVSSPRASPECTTPNTSSESTKTALKRVERRDRAVSLNWKLDPNEVVFLARRKSMARIDLFSPTRSGATAAAGGFGALSPEPYYNHHSNGDTSTDPVNGGGSAARDANTTLADPLADLSVRITQIVFEEQSTRRLLATDYWDTVRLFRGTFAHMQQQAKVADAAPDVDTKLINEEETGRELLLLERAAYVRMALEELTWETTTDLLWQEDALYGGLTRLWKHTTPALRTGAVSHLLDEYIAAVSAEWCASVAAVEERRRSDAAAQQMRSAVETLDAEEQRVRAAMEEVERIRRESRLLPGLQHVIAAALDCCREEYLKGFVAACRSAVFEHAGDLRVFHHGPLKEMLQRNEVLHLQKREWLDLMVWFLNTVHWMQSAEHATSAADLLADTVATFLDPLGHVAQKPTPVKLQSQTPDLLDHLPNDSRERKATPLLPSTQTFTARTSQSSSSSEVAVLANHNGEFQQDDEGNEETTILRTTILADAGLPRQQLEHLAAHAAFLHNLMLEFHAAALVMWAEPLARARLVDEAQRIIAVITEDFLRKGERPPPMAAHSAPLHNAFDELSFVEFHECEQQSRRALEDWWLVDFATICEANAASLRYGCLLTCAAECSVLAYEFLWRFDLRRDELAAVFLYAAVESEQASRQQIAAEENCEQRLQWKNATEQFQVCNDETSARSNLERAHDALHEEVLLRWLSETVHVEPRENDAGAAAAWVPATDYAAEFVAQHDQLSMQMLVDMQMVASAVMIVCDVATLCPPDLAHGFSIACQEASERRILQRNAEEEKSLLMFLQDVQDDERAHRFYVESDEELCRVMLEDQLAIVWIGEGRGRSAIQQERFRDIGLWLVAVATVEKHERIVRSGAFLDGESRLQQEWERLTLALAELCLRQALDQVATLTIYSASLACQLLHEYQQLLLVHELTENTQRSRIETIFAASLRKARLSQYRREACEDAQMALWSTSLQLREEIVVAEQLSRSCLTKPVCMVLNAIQNKEKTECHEEPSERQVVAQGEESTRHELRKRERAERLWQYFYANEQRERQAISRDASHVREQLQLAVDWLRSAYEGQNETLRREEYERDQLRFLMAQHRRGAEEREVLRGLSRGYLRRTPYDDGLATSISLGNTTAATPAALPLRSMGAATQQHVQQRDDSSGSSTANLMAVQQQPSRRGGEPLAVTSHVSLSSSSSAAGAIAGATASSVRASNLGSLASHTAGSKNVSAAATASTATAAEQPSATTKLRVKFRDSYFTFSTQSDELLRQIVRFGRDDMRKREAIGKSGDDADLFPLHLFCACQCERFRDTLMIRPQSLCSAFDAAAAKARCDVGTIDVRSSAYQWHAAPRDSFFYAWLVTGLEPVAQANALDSEK